MFIYIPHIKVEVMEHRPNISVRKPNAPVSFIQYSVRNPKNYVRIFKPPLSEFNTFPESLSSIFNNLLGSLVKLKSK